MVEVADGGRGGGGRERHGWGRAGREVGGNGVGVRGRDCSTAQANQAGHRELKEYLFII